MPRRKGQFAVIVLNGTLRSSGDNTGMPRRAGGGPRDDFVRFHVAPFFHKPMT